MKNRRNKKKWLVVLPLLSAGYILSNGVEQINSVRSFQERFEEEQSRSKVKRTPSSERPSKQDFASENTVAEIQTDIRQVRRKQAARKIYQNLRSYPSSTMPLKGDSQADPIKTKYSAQNLSTIGEEKSSLEVDLDKTVYSEGELIELKVKSFFEGEQFPSRVLVTNNGIVLKSFETNEAGEFTLKFNASRVGAGDHLLNIHAQVKGEAAELSLGYKVQSQEVEFVEALNSEVSSEGNLVFNSRIRFLINGNYLIKGVIYDSNGRLIGQAKSHLANVQGEREVPLSFYGKLIHDSKRDGPYILKSLEVIRVDEELSYISQTYFDIEKKTAELSYSMFRNDAYFNEDLEKKITWLE